MPKFSPLLHAHDSGEWQLRSGRRLVVVGNMLTHSRLMPAKSRACNDLLMQQFRGVRGLKVAVWGNSGGFDRLRNL